MIGREEWDGRRSELSRSRMRKGRKMAREPRKVEMRERMLPSASVPCTEQEAGMVFFNIALLILYIYIYKLYCSHIGAWVHNTPTLMEVFYVRLTKFPTETCMGV